MDELEGLGEAAGAGWAGAAAEEARGPGERRPSGGPPFFPLPLGPPPPRLALKGRSTVNKSVKQRVGHT